MPSEKARSMAALGGWLLAGLAAGAVGALSGTGATPWYEALEKPSFTPPSAVFGPVWTTLYLAMGVAAWLVWRRPPSRERTAALGLFLAQLVLNALWSWIFFAWRAPGPALAELALLWLLVAADTWLFFRQSRAAGLILLVYLAWLTFAAALNAGIVLRN